jgi:hypothetical protein
MTMDTTKDYAGIVSAAKDFFGPLHDGDGPAAFVKEWKALTDADKQEIKDGLVKIGYKIAS